MNLDIRLEIFLKFSNFSIKLSSYTLTKSLSDHEEFIYFAFAFYHDNGILFLASPFHTSNHLQCLNSLW